MPKNITGNASPRKNPAGNRRFVLDPVRVFTPPIAEHLQFSENLVR
ncbi:MAG: hypothetical protein IAE83_17850 [Anaerolinea sp.]|nr:hypothetical protein [Anaerolinea sp.]MCC6973195.1 hypothetical protein [Anaerolineae bacterium]